MQIFATLFLYIFLAPFAPATDTPEWSNKISPEIWMTLEEDPTVDCIILFHSQANLSAALSLKTKTEKGRFVFKQLRQQQQQSQAGLQQELRREDIPFQSLYLINALRLKADENILRRIAQRTEVKQVLPNPTIQLTAPRAYSPQVTGRGGAIEWNLLDIRANEVWNMGFRGQGVVVGGQDTGVDWDHPTLVRQYRGKQADTVDHNYNWYDAIHEYSPLHGDTTNPCGLNLTAPCDDNVHGTHTVGTMVGADTVGNQIGVAPAAQWIAVRNMERGYGNPFSYLEAFQWFLAPTDVLGQNPNPDLAPHVINNSWYCPELEGCNESNIGLLEAAVEALRAAGVVVVVSAGNFGNQCETVGELPAIFPAAFAVGATDINQNIASFSSRGPVYQQDSSILIKPDVSAPGVNVRSASLNGNFASFSGTSMAGPHVAGTVALMISANPNLSGQVDTIEAILRRTARARLSAQDCGPLTGDQVPNAVFGYGIIDAKAAVEAALQVVISDTKIKVSDENNIQVFPNPSRGQITLSRQDNQEPVLIQLRSLNGQILRQTNWQDQSATLDWDLGALPHGLYLISYRLRKKTFTEKLVVQ